MIKVLLTSDFHLGAENEGSPVPDPVRIGTFRKVCALAKEHQVLMVAGDLFHRHNVSRREIELVAEEFKALRESGVSILCLPGECECLEDGAPAPWLAQINATHVFTTDQPYICEHQSQRLFVYGVPACPEEPSTFPRRRETDGFHMGLFHTGFDINDQGKGRGGFALNKTHLKAMNLDFYAMGHQHQFRIYKSKNRIIAAYPGSPEALSRDETGDRYALSITIENDEIQQIKRLTVNSLRIADIKVLCDEISSPAQIEDILETEKSPRTVLFLTLTGERGFTLHAEDLARHSGNYFALHIEDNSVPTLESLIKEYAGENSLRGEFYSCLKEMAREGFPPGTDERAMVRILDPGSRKGPVDAEEWSC